MKLRRFPTQRSPQQDGRGLWGDNGALSGLEFRVEGTKHGGL